MSRVLVAIPRVHETSHAGLERLRAAGCELIFNSHGRTLTEAELAAMKERNPRSPQEIRLEIEEERFLNQGVP